VQWKGLPLANCSWELTDDISVEFEPAEFSNNVPDFTGVPNNIIENALTLGDIQAQKYSAEPHKKNDLFQIPTQNLRPTKKQVCATLWPVN